MKKPKYMAKGGNPKYMAKGGNPKYMSKGGAAFQSEMKANSGMGNMPKSVVDALEGKVKFGKLGPYKDTSGMKKNLQKIAKKSAPTKGMK
tara:strand:+ start:64 stop:333 length:270 start_codon:yes stop_codon:yes gene_type:complete